MKRLFGLVLVTTVLPLVMACDTYVQKEALFVGYNVSNDNVVALVNDGEEHPIAANRSAQFVVVVPIAKNPVQPWFGTPTGPSLNDKSTQVSVAFRNLRTGKLTTPIFCNSGAKLVTTIRYEMSSFGYESTSCQASYSY